MLAGLAVFRRGAARTARGRNSRKFGLLGGRSGGKTLRARASLMTAIDLELSIRLSAAIGVPVTVRREGSLLVAWMMDEPHCVAIGKDKEALFNDAKATRNVASDS